MEGGTILRFTIRELLILTVTVGLGIAWLTDRSRLYAALEKSDHEREYLEWVRNDLEEDIVHINGQLVAHGLELRHACQMRPIVAPVNRP
jgi:hypothetical protein